jgi:hypothetical protein
MPASLPAFSPLTQGLTDDQVLFLVALASVAIVLGLATLLERGLCWLNDRYDWLRWFSL